MKWWNQLSYRVSAFIILLAIVPLAGFGITTINEFRQSRLNSVAQIHKGIISRSIDLIESSLAETEKEILLVIQSNDFEHADVSDQEWLMQLLIKNLPNLYTLTLADMSGQEKVKVGRETVYNQKDLEKHTDHPSFKKEGEQKAIIGGLHKTKDNLLKLDMFVPLFSPMERRVTAILIAEINIEDFLSFIADLRIEKTGYAYVVDADGKVLVHPDHSVVLAGDKRLENPVVQEFMSGQKILTANARYTNYQQIRMLSNAQAVAEPKVLVVIVQSVDEALAEVTRTSKWQIAILFLVLIGAGLLSLYFAIKTFKPLRRLETGTRLIGTGDLAHRIPVTSSDELGTVTRSFNKMAEDLEAVGRKDNEQNWLKEGVSELDNLLRGEQSLEKICVNVITFMATYLQKQVGVIYAHDGQGSYRYTAGYAFKPGALFSLKFRTGEGLPGQAVSEKKSRHFLIFRRSIFPSPLVWAVWFQGILSLSPSCSTIRLRR